MHLKKIYNIAKEFDISNILKQYPHQVSGGQRQRCAAARAVVMEPALIIADEPTGALDSVNAKTLMDMFSEIHMKFGSTILLVTHDPIVASYAQRILFLKDGNIHKEIHKNKSTNRMFYKRILTEMAAVEGGVGC